MKQVETENGCIPYPGRSYSFSPKKVDSFKDSIVRIQAKQPGSTAVGFPPLKWVMIDASSAPAVGPSRKSYDFPRCSGVSSRHGMPCILRYQMVYHQSASVSKVNLTTCHGSYSLKFSFLCQEPWMQRRKRVSVFTTVICLDDRSKFQILLAI